MNIQYEIWRDVGGYEDYYQVTNFGRVKRLAGKGCRQERILKPQKRNDGYLQVCLFKKGKMKNFLVHRLVAQAFIPNPDNLPCVNHRDENPSNNFVFVREDGSIDFKQSNLEWCTQGYNLEYGTARERMAKALTNGKKSKRVAQKTKDGELVKIWPSTMEVQRQTGYDQGNIGKCCRGKQKSYKGYLWEYV